jgi:hypothetical protein
MMLYLQTILGAALLLLPRQNSPEPQQQKSEPQQPQIQESRMISTSATVEAINQETRMVTVRGPHGNTCTFKADDSIKNLGQVKVGDRVVVDYYESVAVQVIKPGTAESGQEMVVESAQPGEEPAGAAAEKTTIIATVECIDRAAPSITLKDSEGNETTVRVRHPERLKLVKVGDTLKITLQQAVAVAVRPPPDSAH